VVAAAAGRIDAEKRHSNLEARFSRWQRCGHVDDPVRFPNFSDREFHLAIYRLLRKSGARGILSAIIYHLPEWNTGGKMRRARPGAIL
jgi:hypothetical protein